jgi:YHS domain-containing protein
MEFDIRSRDEDDLATLARRQTMNDSTPVTKDPICGMTVDPKTALQAEREGTHFYFCSDHCREKFLSAPVGTKPEGNGGGCCG